MRKITEAARHAFLAGREWKQSNTSVEVRGFQNATTKWVILLLHGNPIARYRLGDTSLRSLRVCDGNWQTVTTKDRLNSLPGVRVHQKAGQWYLNGEPWDGCWSTVTPQFTITEEVAFDTKDTLRWRVEYPERALPPVFFPTREAAEAFVAVEEANMGLARRSA